MTFVSIGYIRDACNHRYPDSLPTRTGETLFVNSNKLPQFVKECLPSLTVPFVLVTGCSDITIPFHLPQESKEILKNPLVLKWFAHNCAMKVGKLEHIPIGLDYEPLVCTLISTPEEYSVFEGLPILPFDSAIQEGWIKVNENEEITHIEDITNINIESLQKVEKKHLCYGNFHFFTCSLYGDDRKAALAKIPADCIEYEEKRISRTSMFTKMAQYKYIVSPFGNGLDCHRTWEALSIGCIPIVRSSGLNPMFEGLPVMIVNDWSEITKEKLDSFIPDRSQMEKLTLEYWMNRLNSFLDNSVRE